MNSNELRCVLSRDKKINKSFIDVFAMDEFKEYSKRNKTISDNSVFVVNSETSMNSGEHWLLIYVKRKLVYFIDSFRKDPKFYKLENILYQIRNKIEFLNQIQLLSSFSNICGEYCIFFSFNLCRDKSLREILNYFSYDFFRNDESVKSFMRKTFPGHERESYYIY